MQGSSLASVLHKLLERLSETGLVPDLAKLLTQDRNILLNILHAACTVGGSMDAPAP